MGLKIRVLVITTIAFSLFCATDATEGLAVYYNPPYYKPTPACKFPPSTGVMVAGVRDNLWGCGRACGCGSVYRVRCIGGANEAPHPCKQGSVTVTVIDYCGSKCEGDINLSFDAFNRIADPNAGKVRIDYERIR